MKQELVDILACPVCHGKLALTADEENGKEIVSGSLYCPQCAVHYPIVDTVPELLPRSGSANQDYKLPGSRGTPIPRYRKG